MTTETNLDPSSLLPEPPRPKNCPNNVRRTFRRGTKIWVYQFHAKIDGHRFYGPWRGSPKEAVKDEDAIRSRAKMAALGGPLTFGQATRLLLEDPGLKDETKRYYREIFRSWLDHLVPVSGNSDPAQRDVELHLITREKIELVLKAREAVVSPSRINKTLGALGRLFRVAQQRANYFGDNPVDRIERKRLRRVEAAYLTLEEVDKVLMSMRCATGVVTVCGHDIDGSQAADLVAMLFLSGVRRRELARLHVADIDFSAGMLRIDGKSGPRTIPISVPLSAILKRLSDGSSPDASLVARWLRTEGQRSNWLRAAFVALRKFLPNELRERFHMHTLRHALRTHLEEHEVPITHSMFLLGHAPPSMTFRYAHAPLKSVRKTISRVLDPLVDFATPGAERKGIALRSA